MGRLWGAQGERCGRKAREFHGHFAEMSEKGEGRTETRQCKPDSERVRGMRRSQSPEPAPRESDGRGGGGSQLAHSGHGVPLLEGCPLLCVAAVCLPGVSAWMSPRPGWLPHSRRQRAPPPRPLCLRLPARPVPCPSRPLHSGFTRSGLVYSRSLEPRVRSVNVCGMSGCIHKTHSRLFRSFPLNPLFFCVVFLIRD